MVQETISKKEFQNGYILDGFPRTIAQAEAFDELLANRGEKIDAFIALEVPEEELVSRLVNRGQGREDDSPEKIKVRLKVYENETSPVMLHYQKKGLFKSVIGMGTVEEIQQSLLDSLN